MDLELDRMLKEFQQSIQHREHEHQKTMIINTFYSKIPWYHYCFYNRCPCCDKFITFFGNWAALMFGTKIHSCDHKLAQQHLEKNIVLDEHGEIAMQTYNNEWFKKIKTRLSTYCQKRNIDF